MNRAVARSIACALFSLALLAPAVAAFAQGTVAAPAAKSAPAAHKPAAKPAAGAKRIAAKPARWAPRARYRRYTRWSRNSRWGWRAAWRKPAAAKSVAAKPAAKALGAKPAAKAASAWAVKPAAKAASAKAAAPAKPTAALAARTAVKATPKPAAYAARPVSKPVWNPAPAVKTAAWAKPGAKPIAATLAAAAPAAKPIAKAAAKPGVKFAAGKGKPAAAASKIQPTPESLTRDANNGAVVSGPATTIAGGDRLDIMGQIIRMVGALLVVMLLVVGVLYVLRRTRLVAVAEAGAPASATKPLPAPASQSKGLAAAIMPVFGNLTQARGKAVSPPAVADILPDSMVANGGMQIVGAQPLPGSGTIVYLVRIEDHMVLLGASYAGGVRLLAEWEKDDQPETEAEKQAFDSYLRQQGVGQEEAKGDEEEHTFATIRARLNSTADRLAGLRAEFGG